MTEVAIESLDNATFFVEANLKSCCRRSIISSRRRGVFVERNGSKHLDRGVPLSCMGLWRACLLLVIFIS
jgi:hypothetical protein